MDVAGREAQVTREMSDLHSTMAIINDRLLALRERLNLVLSDSKAEKVMEEIPKEQLVPLANEIRGIKQFGQEVVVNINDILDRLEV